MTDAEINAAALTDPDNPPLTPEHLQRMKRVPRAKVIRRAFHLTQEEFAARFRIPLGTLRDWEQGKTEPDQAARAYLKVIARNPDAVIEALNWEPPPDRAELGRPEPDREAEEPPTRGRLLGKPAA
jgi:putative transcriptional regulator